MLVLRCTARLARLLPVPRDVASDVRDDPSAGSWFVDVVTVRRTRCLLATHSPTLYSVVVPHARKTDLARLADVFRAALFDALRPELFGRKAVTFFERHLGTHVLGKTNSRNVLGSLVDLRYQLLEFLDDQSELGAPQFAAAGRVLNRVPMSFLDYRYPVDAMAALVAHEPA